MTQQINPTRTRRHFEWREDTLHMRASVKPTQYSPYLRKQIAEAHSTPFIVWIKKRKAGLKWCSGCRAFLPANKTTFSLDDSQPDGVSTYCKACVAERRTKSKMKGTGHDDKVETGAAREARSPISVT